MLPALPALYIELLKKTIINEIYLENEIKQYYLVSGLLFGTPVDLRHLVRPQTIPGELTHVVKNAKENGHALSMMHPDPAQRGKQPDSRNFTEFPHSMIGRKRMDNLQFAVETILSEKIPGDFLEAGIWRGGATIFLRGLLAAHGITDRKVFAADSFEGVPPPTLPQDKLDISKKTLPVLAVGLEEVRELFARYGLLDEQVVFLKGWFKDSLPQAKLPQLSLLRADGDLYESTMDILNNAYEKVSPGGFVIIDDYNEPNLACKDAVNDFRTRHRITAPLHPIDDMAVYWRV